MHLELLPLRQTLGGTFVESRTQEGSDVGSLRPRKMDEIESNAHLDIQKFQYRRSEMAESKIMPKGGTATEGNRIDSSESSELHSSEGNYMIQKKLM